MVTTETLRLVLDTIADVREAVKSFNRLNKAITKTTRNTIALNKHLQKSSKYMNELSKATAQQNALNKEFATRGRDKMEAYKNSLMKAGFGLLFQGMAVYRFFTNLGKSMLDTYMLAEGQNSTAVKQINSIAGAWEFVKYGIADAMAQSGLINSVYETVLKIATWFADLSDDQKKTIGDVIIWGAALGGISMLLGQLALGYLAILESAALLGIEMSALKNMASIAIGLYFVWDAIDDFKTGNWISAISKALIGAGFLAAAIGFGPAGWILGTLGIAIMILNTDGFKKDISDIVDYSRARLKAFGDWFTSTFELAWYQLQLLFAKQMKNERLVATYVEKIKALKQAGAEMSYEEKVTMYYGQMVAQRQKAELINSMPNLGSALDRINQETGSVPLDPSIFSTAVGSSMTQTPSNSTVNNGNVTNVGTIVVNQASSGEISEIKGQIGAIQKDVRSIIDRFGFYPDNTQKSSTAQ